MEDAQQAPHHRHHRHHRKKKTYLPRDKDLVIGAAHHPGTKFFLNLVEFFILNYADGLSFNDKISEAIWHEICEYDIEVLVPTTGDLTKEARKATKKEREEFFRDCYEKVTENRASVKPPHLVDAWVSNEDHPGTNASLAIIKDSLQEGGTFPPSTTTPSSQATTLQAAAGNNGVVIVKKVINEHVVEITEMLNGQMIRQSLRRFQPGERETL